jgi:hypothetical protein
MMMDEKKPGWPTWDVDVLFKVADVFITSNRICFHLTPPSLRINVILGFIMK